MNLPEGYTEEQLVETLYRIANSLASTYTFGYFDREDIVQEGVISALEALKDGKYDQSRPLENFAYTHMRNRLYNNKRNKYFRRESPCQSCPHFDPDNKISPNQNQCAAFTDKNDCDKWDGWLQRNTTKQNLMNPLNIVEIDDEKEKRMRISDNIINDIYMEDLRRIIDAKLPVEIRSDYLKMLTEKVSISKIRRARVQQVIIEILEEEGIEWQALISNEAD